VSLPRPDIDQVIAATADEEVIDVTAGDYGRLRPPPHVEGEWIRKASRSGGKDVVTATGVEDEGSRWCSVERLERDRD